MSGPISGVPCCSSTRARRPSACAPSGSAACLDGAACRSGGRTSRWPSSATGSPFTAAPLARLSGGLS
eukprot:1516727-Alexandrium_andersonii.AAC.1